MRTNHFETSNFHSLVLPSSFGQYGSDIYTRVTRYTCRACMRSRMEFRSHFFPAIKKKRISFTVSEYCFDHDVDLYYIILNRRVPICLVYLSKKKKKMTVESMLWQCANKPTITCGFSTRRFSKHIISLRVCGFKRTHRLTYLVLFLCDIACTYKLYIL